MDDGNALQNGLLVSSIRAATPLLFVLLGECLTQRVGRINLGVEGQMLVGAASGYGVAAATGNPWLGLLAGAAAGTALSLVYALLTVPVRANQFAAGLAVWMLGFGLSAYAGAGLVGQRVEGFEPLAGGMTPTMVLALLLVPVIGLWLYTTRSGLAWRAVGESPAVARAAGVRPAMVITMGIVAGGVLSGLGGAALSVDYTRTWAEGMSGGRGLVAVGLVIVARWNPWWTLPAALLFGGAEALSLRMQAAHSAIPAHLLHTLPYLASLAVFAIACLRLRDSGAPAALKDVLQR
ncbi:MAG: ABC transporter permease [Variovorax sp.]